MTQTALALDADDLDFLDAQVASGRFATRRDAVKAGLELLAEELKMQALEAALREADESGPPVPYDPQDFVREMHAKYLS